jgi:hypothetical protein
VTPPPRPLPDQIGIERRAYSGLRSEVIAAPLVLVICRADSRVQAFTPVRDLL